MCLCGEVRHDWEISVTLSEVGQMSYDYLLSCFREDQVYMCMSGMTIMQRRFVRHLVEVCGRASVVTMAYLRSFFHVEAQTSMSLGKIERVDFTVPFLEVFAISSVDYQLCQRCTTSDALVIYRFLCPTDMWEYVGHHQHTQCWHRMIAWLSFSE